jgi:hypothetical protein
MSKFRKISQRSRATRHLVLCEGETEVWYFNGQLDSRKFKVKKSNKSNAQNLIKIDAQNEMSNADWNVIYCVFDHDPKSNSKEQLQTVNKIIKTSNGKLERVFSKPCFEIIFLFNFSKDSHIFASNNDVEEALNKQIKKKQPDYRYEKTEKCIQQLCVLTDFNQICSNSKTAYANLNIDDNNWLETEYGYSEISKLI